MFEAAQERQEATQNRAARFHACALFSSHDYLLRALARYMSLRARAHATAHIYLCASDARPRFELSKRRH